MKHLIYLLVSRWFLSGCSNYNSQTIRKAARSKSQAKQAFVKLGMPTAKAIKFYLPTKAFSFVRKYGFPVVIKPNVGGFSRGAYFPIRNYQQLLYAAIFVKIWWPSSLIEQYLSGDNYRIVVLKDAIMAVVKRHPPFIIGDGKHSIATLIDKENQIRTQMQLLPIIRPIAKKYALKRHLKAQGLSLSSIVAKDKKITLSHKISLKCGAVIEAIPKSVLSENNYQTLIALIKHFNANILGIDLICKASLAVDFNQQNCIFLEVNTRPFLKMHEVVRFGSQTDLSPYNKQLKQIEQT